MPPKKVEFEEDNFMSGKQTKVNNQSNYSGGGATGWLIRHHMATSEKSAQYVLLAIVGVNILIIILIVRSFI